MKRALFCLFPFLCTFSVVKAQDSILYWQNGNKKIETVNIKGSGEGYQKFWSENGVLQESVGFRDGSYFGIWKTFDEKGVLKQLINVIGVGTVRVIGDTLGEPILKVVISGRYISYHKNGFKKSDGYRIQDRKFGIWNYYNEKGDLIRREEYPCFQEDAIITEFR